MTDDVTKEAKAIRDALNTMGWRYLGGGPYPAAPVMRFIGGGRRMSVAINPEIDKDARIAALEAENARLRGGRVKPLEWDKYGAITIVGEYRLWPTANKNNDKHMVTLILPDRKSHTIGYFDGEDAAQADYERRILSALAPAPEPADDVRERVKSALSNAIGGDTYDCLRVWEAWGVGTMSENDFHPVIEDDDRISELADAALSALPARVSVAEAAREVIEARLSTYSARNGRQVSIEDSNGEKCWIVPFDEMAALEAALAAEGGEA